MALATSNLVEQMSQLDAARNLVLGDSALYPQIVRGILPLIGPTARIELQRWGAEFLAETFSSPAFSQQPKQKLASEVLHAIRDLMDIPGGDSAVIRGAIQAAASVYALIFRHMYVLTYLLWFGQDGLRAGLPRARRKEKGTRLEFHHQVFHL